MKAEKIIELVCEYYHLKSDQVISYIDRNPKRVECRYVCYYFLNSINDMGWTEISKYFTGFFNGQNAGHPGHATIIHGVGVIKGRIDVYPSFAQNIAELKNIIMGNIVSCDECTTIFQENDFYNS